MSHSNNYRSGRNREFVDVYPGPPKSAFVMQDEELTDEEDEDTPSARSILARTKHRSSTTKQREEDVEPDISNSSRTGRESRSRHERVRADALQLLQMANDKSGSLSPKEWSGNRERMDDSLEEDDDDIVNVVSMGSRGTNRPPPADLDEIIIQEEEKVDGPKRSGRWSHRYSVASTMQRMQGPLGRKEDEDESRPKSANNMYRSRAPPSVSTSKSVGTMLRDFMDRFDNEDEEVANQTSPSSRVSLLKSMWLSKKPTSPTWSSNVNLADRSAKLPEDPYDSRPDDVIIQEELRRRRNKRLLFVVFVSALVVIVITTVVLTTRSAKDAPSATTTTKSNASTLSFVITADTFRPADQAYLNKQLYDLPKDASFLVHLGDLSVSETSLCSRSVYADAKDQLKASSLVTFVLPGEEDWNNCPKPSTALTYWRENLGSFEQNFELTNMPPIEHAFNRVENFSFFWDGILVLGLNLVGGTVQSESEWTERHTENVRFTEQKLHHYQHELKAVILFGHAEPTSKVGDYFWPVCQQINSLNIPMLYLHASSKDNQILLTYQPFTHTPNLYAAPTRPNNPDVGSPFLKVSVDISQQGEDMFQFAQL